MAERRRAEARRGPSERLSALAEEAIQAFREDNPDAFTELTKAFEGKSANLALLGHGKFRMAVQNGEVRIEPDVVRGAGKGTGHGAISPETLLDIVEGRLTPLQAFFKGDLIARSDSDDLHLAYDYFVRFADAALRSKKLQGLIGKFREMAQIN